MKIDNQKYTQIGDLAEMLGVTTRTIRYYEEIGLMEPPTRLEGGIRVYSKDDILRLKFILKLKELGISLKEMENLANIYKTHKTTTVIMPKLMEILDYHIAKIDNKMSTLASLRNDIVEYRNKVLSLEQKNR